MTHFKITYQDRALNKIYISIQAETWAAAIVTALERKKAEEKLVMIEVAEE